jgi:hypothetical protein
MPKLALTVDVRYRETDPITYEFGGANGVSFDRLKTVTNGVGLRQTF